MRFTDSDYDEILDIREVDGQPFSDIVGLLDDLGQGEKLLLVNSFEPVPLCAVLSDRGLEHETTQVSENEWHVEISRT